MKRLLATTFSILLASTALSVGAPLAVPGASTDPVAACKDHVPFGAPVSEDKTKTFGVVCHPGYLSHYDEKAHIPDWVSYTLTQFGLLGCNDRQGGFKRDPSLSAAVQASTSDYDSGGYDRGHLANAQDMKYDPEIEAESFYMTNMTPQKPSFNRGIWKQLEDMVRSWSAYRDGDNLTIISGPVYNINADSKLGKNKVDIPTGFFKIIVDPDVHDAVTRKPLPPEAIAFLFKDQNNTSTETLEGQRASIEDIEKLTNLNFQLPQGIDKTKITAMWPSENGQYKQKHSLACDKQKTGN